MSMTCGARAPSNQLAGWGAAQQIKMVSREACVCAMCSRTRQGLHVCMRAYLRNLLGSAACCWPNHCCGTAFVQFFCSLFVNLLCRKPEIESLRFTCNWLVLVGRLAWTSATCTYFRVADKFTTAKRKAGTLYQILRDTQLSFGCCVGLAQLKETPAHRTAASTSLWLRSNFRRCTSEPTPHLHAPPAMFIEVTSATLRAHPKQALSTARQEGRGVREPLNTTTSASSSWSRPRNICSACLSRWHLPRRSPPFIRLGPQPTPKCWQQWPTDELTPSRKCLLPPAWWRQTTTGLAFDSRMLKLKMKSQRGRAGRRWGARVIMSTVDCARSPYGESTFGIPHALVGTRLREGGHCACASFASSRTEITRSSCGRVELTLSTCVAVQHWWSVLLTGAQAHACKQRLAWETPGGCTWPCDSFFSFFSFLLDFGGSGRRFPWLMEKSFWRSTAVGLLCDDGSRLLDRVRWWPPHMVSPEIVSNMKRWTVRWR